MLPDLKNRITIEILIFHAKLHKKQTAIEQLQQAMKKTDDKMLQLIYSTNIMALK